MRSKFYKSTSFLLILILSLTIFTLPVGALNEAPSLGTASPYGILGATTTVTGQTYVSGSLGSGGATGTAIVSGSTDVANIAYTKAFTDLGAAITIAGSQPADSTDSASDLGGKTLTPGVHKFTGAVTIGTNTTLTLSGSGVFIFQIGGAFKTEADSITKLSGGAQACNIIWVADVATIGANSTLEGTLLSKSAITVGAGSVTNGRILAKTEVTANAANTKITVPGPCIALATPTPTPTDSPASTVTPTPGATAIPTATATVTPSPTATVTPTPAATITPTPTATVTPIPAATVTPTHTPAATITPTPAATPTTAPVPGVTPPATTVSDTAKAACSSSVSIVLDSKGNMIIHAMLPNNEKGTGTWNFDLGGKTYKVKGSEDVTYTAANVPVGTYKVGAQFIPDNNGKTVDLSMCTVSVPTVTGGKLPNTATPWYNLLFVGAGLSIMGTAVWIRRKIHG